MDPNYKVSVDVGRSLLRLSPTGFFDLDTLRRFAAERDAAVRSLPCGPNRHVTLCDIRGQMISTPEIAAEFTRMIQDRRFASRRLAFVVVGALARAQTRRIAQRDDVGYFDTVAAAEAWLFEPHDHIATTAIPGRMLNTGAEASPPYAGKSRSYPDHPTI